MLSPILRTPPFVREHHILNKLTAPGPTYPLDYSKTETLSVHFIRLAWAGLAGWLGVLAFVFLSPSFGEATAAWGHPTHGRSGGLGFARLNCLNPITPFSSRQRKSLGEARHTKNKNGGGGKCWKQAEPSNRPCVPGPPKTRRIPRKDPPGARKTCGFPHGQRSGFKLYPVWHCEALCGDAS